MNRPLSWSMRFAFALSAVFAIGALSAGGLSYAVLSRELTQRLAADVRATAESFARVAAEGDRKDVEEQVIAHSLSVRDASALVGFVDAESGQAYGSLRPEKPFEGARRLIVGRDIALAPQPDGEAPDAYLAYGVRTDIGWVMAARDEGWVAESGELLIETTAWALGAALILSFGLAFVIARRNERRIDAMEQVLDEVGAGRLEMRIRDAGNDDLAALAQRVDATLERLEAGIDAIRQVSTDVAHDLRAPLARLRMRLEPQALSQDLPAPVRHEIGSALVDIDAISGTFDAILRLARLQSGTVEVASEPVDLARLAEDVIELLAPSAEDAGHRLELVAPQTSVVVSGDSELLSQALVNLVDNAIRHCPSPARIVVEVGRSAGRPVLTVSDDGPGIPPRDRARVLDRFVRLDPSRTVHGTGLGLSLVAAIARLHAADLALEDNAPGLRARLTFPDDRVPE